MIITATEAKRAFGQLLDTAQREPVTIEKNGRPFAVVLSKYEFDTLQQQLQELRSEIETAHLLRGGNRERLLAAVDAHQRGEEGKTMSVEELEALLDDDD